jgi:hypothetical protein
MLLEQGGAQHLDLGARELLPHRFVGWRLGLRHGGRRLLLGQNAGEQVLELVGGADEGDAR